MSYIVYRHITPSGKSYVGITGQKPKRRWQNGYGYIDNNYFWKAICKYGWNNIKHEILYSNLTQEEAFQKEIESISKFKSNDRKFGYNLSTGGESGNAGVRLSEETKEKLRIANTGKIPTEETRKKLSIALKGRVFSEEHKKKISEALAGKPHKGHPHTEESRRKLSKSLTGRKNPHKGYPRSEECRKKLSEYHKGIPAKNRRIVVCLETGEIFMSIKEAGIAKNVAPNNISSCLAGLRKRTASFHWMYLEDYEQASTAKQIIELLEGKD